MKTKTEKEIVIEDKWMDAITKNIWSSVGSPEDNPIRINWEGMNEIICEAKLEGYRKAKKEFNKKVEEETLRLEANLVNSLKSKDWEIINKYFGIFREEINKIFKEEKSK